MFAREAQMMLPGAFYCFHSVVVLDVDLINFIHDSVGNRYWTFWVIISLKHPAGLKLLGEVKRGLCNCDESFKEAFPGFSEFFMVRPELASSSFSHPFCYLPLHLLLGRNLLETWLHMSPIFQKKSSGIIFAENVSFICWIRSVTIYTRICFKYHQLQPQSIGSVWWVTHSQSITVQFCRKYNGWVYPSSK